MQASGVSLSTCHRLGFRSDPTNAGYSLPEQGKRILGVLDALGLKQAILVGHSFGGGPTVEAALMGTDRIKGLVLVDAALGLDAAPGDGPSIQKALMGVTPLRDALSAATITNPMLTKTFLRSFIFNKDAATDARVAIYQKPFIVEGSTKAISSWVPTFLSTNQVAKSLDPKAYAALRMPVSLIWGSGGHDHTREPGRTGEATRPSCRAVAADRCRTHPTDRGSRPLRCRPPEVLDEHSVGPSFAP